MILFMDNEDNDHNVQVVSLYLYIGFDQTLI